MKKILLLLAISCFHLAAYAQYDPNTNSYNYGCGVGVPPDVCMGTNSSSSSSSGASTRSPTNSWGAIAHASGTTVFTWAAGYDSKNRATNAALNSCRRESGIRCERSLLLLNQCFAVARNSSYYSTNYGNNKRQAERRALRACRGGPGGEECEILISQCSTN